MIQSWLRFHERNIIREAVGEYNKIEAGQIIRFNYSGKDAHVKRPLVLVLNPRWENKLHAVSLDYISDEVLLKLKNIVQDTLQQRIAQLIKLRLSLLKADIKDPYHFYYDRLKPFIKVQFGPNESPYRTYIINNISNLRVIDYRLKGTTKHFYLPSTGQEDKLSAKE